MPGRHDKEPCCDNCLNAQHTHSQKNVLCGIANRSAVSKDGKCARWRRDARWVLEVYGDRVELSRLEDVIADSTHGAFSTVMRKRW